MFKHKKITLIITAVLVFFSNSFMYAESINDEEVFIKNGSRDKKLIALTFDDGPHPKETNQVLDVLNKYNVKGTFFIAGKHANWYPNPLVRASKEGHEIGNHTFNHPDITNLTNAQLEEEILKCEEQIKEISKQLVDKNEVHCCQIAVEGIVYEDEYVTDHQNILKKHHWVKDIKKEIDLPIQLQNDVKMIHQGCCFTYQQDATYYLYINEVGIGSSYFYKDEPLYGNTGIMGEIGLISIKGKTINQRVRECQSQDEFNELLGLLVSMIFTMLDPTRLELSLDLKWNYEEKIIKNILNKIDENCFKNLYFHKDISSMLFEGLAYRGIVYLLKERIERDEKI